MISDAGCSNSGRGDIQLHIDMNIRNLKGIVAALIALPLGIALAQDDGGAEKGKGRPDGKGGPGADGKGAPGRPPSPPQGPPFEQIDTDKSGDIDLAEWIRHSEVRAKEIFERLAGDDDKITQEELRAMLQMRGGPGGPGKGGPPGGDKGKGRPPGGDKGGDKGAPDGKGQQPKRPAADES